MTAQKHTAWQALLAAFAALAADHSALFEDAVRALGLPTEVETACLGLVAAVAGYLASAAKCRVVARRDAQRAQQPVQQPAAQPADRTMSVWDAHAASYRPNEWNGRPYQLCDRPMRLRCIFHCSESPPNDLDALHLYWASLPEVNRKRIELGEKPIYSGYHIGCTTRDWVQWGDPLTWRAFGSSADNSALHVAFIAASEPWATKSAGLKGVAYIAQAARAILAWERLHDVRIPRQIDRGDRGTGFTTHGWLQTDRTDPGWDREDMTNFLAMLKEIEGTEPVGAYG